MCWIRHHVFTSREKSFHLLPFSFLCGYMRISKDSRSTFCFLWAGLLGERKKVDCRGTAEVKCGRQGVDGRWMSVKAGRSRVDHTEKPRTALLAPREPRKVCSLLALPGWADTAKPSHQAAHWRRVQRDAPLWCSQRPSARSMTAGEHPRGARNEVLKTRCQVNSSQRGKGPRSQRAQMFPEHCLHPWLEYTSQTSVQLEPALMTAHRHRHRHTHTHTLLPLRCFHLSYSGGGKIHMV